MKVMTIAEILDEEDCRRRTLTDIYPASKTLHIDGCPKRYIPSIGLIFVLFIDIIDRRAFGWSG